MKTMKAAVVTGPKQIGPQQIPMPSVNRGDLLIKISSCAVCGSDVRITDSGNDRVKVPAIIGHEIAGTVVSVGEDVTQFKVGERVAVGADIPCGACYWCLNGMGNCCDKNYAMGYQFPGGFAEYCLLNSTVVRFGPVCRIPNDVSMDEAALAEPLACCINGMERVFFKPGQSVLVMGSGPIGLMLVQLAKIYGSPLVVLSDVDEKRLEEAVKAKPDHVINSSRENLTTEVARLTNNVGIDVVFTACASAEAHEAAIEVTSKRGFINFFGGLPSSARKISILSNKIHYKELYITGSHGSTPRQHAAAMQLISSKRIDVSSLITHSFGLDDIAVALDTVRTKKGLKVMIHP